MNNREKWYKMISEMAEKTLASDNVVLTVKSLRILVRGGHGRPRRFPDPDDKNKVKKEILQDVIADAIRNSLAAKNFRRSGKIRTLILHDQDIKAGLKVTNCHYLWFC